METTIYIALLIVFFILGLFIKKFFPSYFNEKGKNLATKEDIKEITSISEGVKSLLTYNEKHQSRIKERETEVLLDFFELCSHLDEKLMFSFGDLTNSEKNYPIEHEKYVNELFYKIRISRQRLFIYLPTEHSIQMKAESLFQKCVDVRDIFRKTFGSLKTAVWEEMVCLDNGEMKNYKELAQKADEASKNYHTAINPSYESFRVELNNTKSK